MQTLKVNVPVKVYVSAKMKWRKRLDGTIKLRKDEDDYCSYCEYFTMFLYPKGTCTNCPLYHITHEEILEKEKGKESLRICGDNQDISAFFQTVYSLWRQAKKKKDRAKYAQIIYDNILKSYTLLPQEDSYAN